MNVNNIFITGYSINITENSSQAQFENALDMFEHFLAKSPSYNNLEVCNDFLSYRLGEESLDDLIYIISHFSDPTYTEMLKLLNRIVKGRVKNTLSDTALSSSGLGLVWKGEFIGYYSQGKSVPNVLDALVVNSTLALFELNYNNLALYPIDADSFSDRARAIFDNINFHKDFPSTLLTVKSGDFRLYSIEFARSLKALHNAFPKLSNSGHNPPDLNIIKEETSLAGRTMDCTPQGAAKKELCNKDFIIKGIDGRNHSKKNLNCEYHLKINFDNAGTKLHRSLYNRAYFGLPLIEGKKYIALLHLGKHYD